MTYDNAGKLILRLTLGILLLMHGLHKLVYGVEGIVSMAASRGWPEFIAYGAYVGEVVAPILLILGLYTRAAAVIVIVHMLFALVMAHMGHLGQITNSGGWALELQAFFLFVAVVVALMGAGRYSVGGAGGKYN